MTNRGREVAVVADTVTFPKLPADRSDFESAVVWASAYLDCALALDLGLDEGQTLILTEVVSRLDRLYTEMTWPDGEPEEDDDDD